MEYYSGYNTFIEAPLHKLFNSNQASREMIREFIPSNQTKISSSNEEGLLSNGGNYLFLSSIIFLFPIFN